MRIALILLAAFAISGCGSRTGLVPVTGTNLPQAPYGAEQRPDTDQLLELEALAAPERSVELRRRSEERADDPFDLPPE